MAEPMLQSRHNSTWIVIGDAYVSDSVGRVPGGIYATMEYNYGVPIEQKHSALGIASFVIGLIVGLLLCILVVIAGMITASQPEIVAEESVPMILLGLLVLGGLVVNLVGVGLGIAGLFQQQRKKLFPILGVATNVLIVLGICGLMVLGGMQS